MTNRMWIMVCDLDGHQVSKLWTSGLGSQFRLCQIISKISHTQIYC